MNTVTELANFVGRQAACAGHVEPRTSFYRAHAAPASRSVSPAIVLAPKASPPRALDAGEKKRVLQVLNSERFQDQAVREVYATLLDEGTYLCSWRTMYRVLDEQLEVRERRNQLAPPAWRKPELLAIGPNRLWSWDITKLRGPSPWTYFYLYVILDVFSRSVVGWMIAERESEDLARELIEATYVKQGIASGQLTIHADHGSPMISKSVAQLLLDLGVTKTHSRPHVSDDNPPALAGRPGYSEAQFRRSRSWDRTLKYRPDYPDRFGCLADARAWAQAFFTWYNQAQHHTGLGLLTPASVHYGQAEAILVQRRQTLAAAYAAHPERFVKGAPRLQPLQTAVWINPPKPAGQSEPGMTPSAAQ
jgi:putative transposase